MKKFASAIFLMLFSTILNVSAKSHEQQEQVVSIPLQESWTYAMVLQGVTYKIYFAQTSGTLAIQFYSSTSNAWTKGQIISSDTETQYYKVKDAKGTTYQLYVQDNGATLMCYDLSGNSWKYWQEQK
ncbi:MAG: hypothetical protein EAZ97_09135 [Bacteroidetes bacterium]|nr:MAG: hypothetical protein EAZ97_09135 [Bacteroidota bacterium]